MYEVVGWYGVWGVEVFQNGAKDHGAQHHGSTFILLLLDGAEHHGSQHES